LLRWKHGGLCAAAQESGFAKQTLSDWSNAHYEAKGKNFVKLKGCAEAIPVVEAYQLVTKHLQGQKSRQGQRSDLKPELKPAPGLGCKEKQKNNKVFSPLRPVLDEVIYFVGRRDVWIANFLNLESKHDVHHLKKVVENNNPALIAAVNRGPDQGGLTPYQAAQFVVLPLDLQNTLLQKSRSEQIAGIKAWHQQQPKQGGETEKK
jgi:hypothetical protein